MSDPKISPAERVAIAFGGLRKAARALGLNPSTVSRWKLPKEQGGCDGRVPSKRQAIVLKVAREHGVELTAEDLIPSE